MNNNDSIYISKLDGNTAIATLYVAKQDREFPILIEFAYDKRIQQVDIEEAYFADEQDQNVRMTQKMACDAGDQIWAMIKKARETLI